MNVIVFGATGSVGRLAVDRMLADGHAVTAFSRHPERLSTENDALTRHAGDILDPAAVRTALRGHEAAVITVGAGMALASSVRAQGTLNVIQAMQAEGVRRLICQSTLGAHESWSNLNFFWKRIMFGGLLRSVFRDHERQEDMVRASGLDWTIVRPSAFTDAPATGRYEEGFPPDRTRLALKIPRLDLAAFLSRQLTDQRYLHHAVGIST